MALKDLVAQRASLTEGAVEEIVTEYVRYDPDVKVIAFTPAATKLQNRAKVLVYLVALQGWPFVTDEKIPVDAKPAQISEHVGIPGGTLRPILKELKDRHIIAEVGGRYFVRPVSLSSIKAEVITGQDSSARPVRHRTKQKKDESDGTPATARKKTIHRSASKKTGGLAARFNKWIDDGFFRDPRTLADVQKRFHKEGLIVPQTSVSPYLLGAIRAGRLTREEAEANKKRVWTYRSV